MIINLLAESTLVVALYLCSIDWSSLPQGMLLEVWGDDGRSEFHPIMGWILVESIRLDITHPARELMSIGCLVYYHHIGRRATG